MDDGKVLEGSAAQKNFRALAQKSQDLESRLAEAEERTQRLENVVGTQGLLIQQLQNLFASQTVQRGSGPTA